MNKINKNKVSYSRIIIINELLFLVFFLLQFNNKAIAQEQENESFSIEFVGQLTGNEQFKNNRNLIKSLYNFILGNDILTFHRPISMFFNHDNYWILDQGQLSLFKLDSTDGTFDIIRNNDYHVFPSLVGITNSNEKIYFTDSKLGKIFAVNFLDDNNDLVVLNDTLKLSQPTGIAYNPINNKIYISETTSHSVIVLDSNGNFYMRIGKRGSEPGTFNYPTYIAVDSIGNIYIVDSMNFRVQVFTKDGIYITHFGEQGDGSGFIASPKGIAIDSYGNIYLVDALFNCVQIFDIKGNFLSSIGSGGKETGQFYLPSGIFIDKENTIFIADSYNRRIQMFKLLRVQK